MCHAMLPLPIKSFCLSQSAYSLTLGNWNFRDERVDQKLCTDTRFRACFFDSYRCVSSVLITVVWCCQISEQKAFDVMKYMMFGLGFRRQYCPDMVTLQVCCVAQSVVLKQFRTCSVVCCCGYRPVYWYIQKFYMHIHAYFDASIVLTWSHFRSVVLLSLLF